VTNRLEDLKREFEKGKQRLEALDRERQEVRDTMLRISGAIQVIEELLSHQSPANPQSELAPVNA